MSLHFTKSRRLITSAALGIVLVVNSTEFKLPTISVELAVAFINSVMGRTPLSMGTIHPTGV